MSFTAALMVRWASADLQTRKPRMPAFDATSLFVNFQSTNWATTLPFAVLLTVFHLVE